MGCWGFPPRRGSHPALAFPDGAGSVVGSPGWIGSSRERREILSQPRSQFCTRRDRCLTRYRLRGCPRGVEIRLERL